MGVPVEYIIFTDASCIRHENRTYGGFGVIILNTETKKFTKFGGSLSGRSIVFCEAWAIYQGLKKTTEIMKGREAGVLVVTDSKLNVQILCDWIPRWNLRDWMHWTKRDGTVVKNQDLYRRILTILSHHQEMKVRMTHINSHLKSLDWKRISDKLRSYGVNADESTSKLFITMNSMVDEIAAHITAKLKATDTGYIQLIRRKDDIK